MNPSTVGQPVTFTATVTSGGNPVTTGTVDFTEGATTLADGVAVNASGQATFTTSTLTEGSHTDHRHLQRHAGIPAEQRLGHPGRAAGGHLDGGDLLGQPLDGRPVGHVHGDGDEWRQPGDHGHGRLHARGRRCWPSGIAVNASGQATFTTSTLPPGSHTITATYSGTAAFAVEQRFGHPGERGGHLDGGDLVGQPLDGRASR